MSPDFVTTRRVEFSDTDMAGIVHFANFYRYMEQAEHEYFRSLGLTILAPQPDGAVISWPRVACSCSFSKPAHYEDVLDIQLRVLRRGKRSLTTRYDFVRGTTAVARGELKTVCCRLAPGEPMHSIDIPAPWSERLPLPDSERHA